MDRQNIEESDFLRQYGITIDLEFLKVNGRVLKPPDIATEVRNW